MSVKYNGRLSQFITHLGQPPQIRILFFKVNEQLYLLLQISTQKYSIIKQQCQNLDWRRWFLLQFYKKKFLRKKKTLAQKRPLDTIL